MVFVWDALDGRIRRGDFILIKPITGGIGGERLVIDCINYNGSECVALDFIVRTTDGKEFKPCDIEKFGYRDSRGGLTFEMPADRQ